MKKAKTSAVLPRNILRTALSVLIASNITIQAQEPPVRHSPSWYTGARYQAHARFWIGEDSDPDPSHPHQLDHPLFWTAANQYKRLGIGVHVRHVKSEGEDAIWPSSVGEQHYLSDEDEYGDHPTYGGNLAQRMIDASHAKGRKVILYYLPTVDDRLYAANPDWQVKDKDGVFPRQQNRGYYISLAPQGYKDFLKTRIEELITMGADGIYFDHDHVPEVYDYSAAGEAKCQEMFGKSMSQINNNQREQVRQQIIKDGFDPIMVSMHAINPDSVLLVSANGVTLDFYKNGATIKSEPGFRFKLGGTEIASCVLNAASDGRPPHVWFTPKEEYPDDNELGRYLAWGAIANRDIAESKLAKTPNSENQHIASQLVIGEAASEALVDTTPHRWALVQVSENYLVGDWNIRTASATKEAVPALKYFMGKQIPVGAILDWQIRRGIPEECKLLVVSQWDAAGTPADLQPSIADFISRGGTVIYRSDVANIDTIVSPLKADIQEVGSGNGGLDLVAYHSINEKKLVLALANGSYNNMQIFLSNKYQPTSATNVATGAALTIRPVTGGNIIEFPSFSHLGLISIPYTDDGGGSSPILSGSPLSATVGGSAGDAFNLAITATGAWTLSESLDWLSVSAGAGNGNATVTVRTIRSNTDSVPREGTLTLSAPSATDQTITVSQQPSDELPRRLAHWTFENGGTDISGEGNHLTFQNGAAVSTDAAIGQGGLHLDGVNDLAVASGFRGVLGSRPRTVSAWIKTTANDGVIAAWGSDATSQKCIFRVQSTNGTAGALRLEVNGGYIVGSTDLRDTQWHHVAIVFAEDATPTVTDAVLYVDGELETISAAQDKALGTQFAEWVQLGGFLTSTPFNGSMDEVRIYNYALTQAAITQLADRAAPNSWPSWQASHFPGQTNDDSVSGPNADFDKDGQTNMEEYKRGTDPRVPNGGNPVSLRLAPVGGKQFIELQMTSSRYAENVTATLFESSNLTGWNPAADRLTPLRIEQSGDKLTHTYRGVEPFDGGAEFFRLQFQQSR